ncbi:CHASE2 domain-containing protein [Dulcicalothrix desertica]|nr:CHASE2 domain-containing protein [Dulcicalothrix desertica]TWH51259.1 CHASE2 domain-containing sensor protein [Dulcicalothrix desertica PCC 7102]
MSKSKLVTLSLLGGNLNQGFPVVTALLSHQDQSFKITGSLPGVPELVKLYTKWQILYEAVHQRKRNNQRIKMYQQDINNVSINDFDSVCKELQSTLNTWLKCESFQNIERQLRTLLSQDDEIKVIIETDVILLHRLPWHLWNFFDHYPFAELALSNHEYGTPRVSRTSSSAKVRILAVLGSNCNINIDEDRSLLQKLKNAQITFIVNPTRIELDELLWNQDWDILFFAGHSDSNDDIGKIYINPCESLTVIQLKSALSKAIERGLKLAIFNSCDGMGLAKSLADLNIPQIIVMRERVPDLVAQKFLENFLFAFEEGKSLYLAMREARAKLQGLENDYPCASWLPVIYQNPTTVPTTWQELCGAGTIKTSKTFKIAHLSKTVASTLVVTASVIGLRYLGVFEKPELQTFDQMLVLRPKEELESKVIIIEVTEEYIQSVQRKNLGLKSISDSTLAQLINKLQKHQPQVIGVDIYRDFADPIDKLNPIQLNTELSKNNVITVCKGKDSKYDPQGIKPPNTPLERQGFTDAVEDIDGVVRRQILMMPQEASSPCQTNVSLALQLASRYLFSKGINFSVHEDYIQFGDKIFKRLKPGRSGAYQRVNNLGGIQITINYNDTDYKRIPLEAVLNNQLNQDVLKDKIVIIGVTANSISDYWSTPYSSIRGALEKTPGVFIQAQLVNQLVDAVLNKRPIFRVLPYWGDILWICGWSGGASLIVWRLHSHMQKAGAIVGTIIVLYGICTITLYQGLWLPFIPSVFGIVASGTAVSLKQQKISE